MNIKKETHSQLPTTDSKKQKDKNKLNKQLELEQIHSYGDCLEDYQPGQG